MARRNEDENSTEEKQVTETTVNDVLKTPIILLIGAPDSMELCGLSIAQWDKYFPGYPTLVVGKYKELPAIDFEPSNDSDVNFANILAAIVADECVPEQFILSPVSTFPVNEVSESDLTGLHCISVGLQNQQLSCMKNMSELACTRQLKKEGWENVFNYETGLPVLMEKSKVKILFEKFNPQKYPTKVMSLYLNYFNKNQKPVPVHFGSGVFATRVLRLNPNINIVKKGLQEGLFFTLNNDGYSAVKVFFLTEK